MLIALVVLKSIVLDLEWFNRDQTKFEDFEDYNDTYILTDHIHHPF